LLSKLRIKVAQRPIELYYAADDMLFTIEILRQSLQWRGEAEVSSTSIEPTEQCTGKATKYTQMRSL